MKWQMDANALATVSSDGFALSVDTRRPAYGVHDISRHGVKYPLRVLGISASPAQDVESVSDAYVRGNDLIVAYEQTSDRTARPQMVWEASCQHGQVCLDVTIAMQTSLLESDPSLTVRSRLAGGPVLSLPQGAHGPDAFVPWQPDNDWEGIFMRRLDEKVSYVEIIYPADFRSEQASLDDDGNLQYSLINEFLEKGVIRKAQLRAMLVDRQDDVRAAWDGYLAVQNSAPPLAT